MTPLDLSAHNPAKYDECALIQYSSTKTQMGMTFLYTWHLLWVFFLITGAIKTRVMSKSKHRSAYWGLCYSFITDWQCECKLQRAGGNVRSLLWHCNIHMWQWGIETKERFNCLAVVSSPPRRSTHTSSHSFRIQTTLLSRRYKKKGGKK